MSLQCIVENKNRAPENDDIEKTSRYSRMGHTSLPARPARCIADDFVMSLVINVSKPIRHMFVRIVTIKL